jgi:hypothetical protein
MNVSRTNVRRCRMAASVASRPAPVSGTCSEARKRPGGTPGKARACAGIRPAMWAGLVLVAALSYVGTFALVAWIAG